MFKNNLIACLIAVLLLNAADAMAVSHRHKAHHSSIWTHRTHSINARHSAKAAHARASDRQSNDRQKFIVAIDAGHGGKDTGAIGPSGTYEKQVVYAISRKLEHWVGMDAKMTPVMVRRGDAFIGLQRRAEIAHDAGADLFVSLHADAFHDDGANGSAVFTLLNRGKGHSGPSASARRASNRAAVKILGELRSQQHLHCRQVKRARYAVLKSPDVPSMLIETGFITNPLEERKLASQSHQEKLAHSIYNGIRAYARSVWSKSAKPARSRHVILASRQ